MLKTEFLDLLRARLSRLSPQEIEERLIFYSEMIDDRMEEGLSEEDAVSAVGKIDEVVEQILADASIDVQEEPRKTNAKRKLKSWEIVLLVLGSPIWASLAIAAGAVVFAVYVSVWSLLISLWSVFVALAGSSLGALVMGIACAIGTDTVAGLAIVSAGVVCAGLSIFAFFGCRAATKGVVVLTKRTFLIIRTTFSKRSEKDA